MTRDEMVARLKYYLDVNQATTTWDTMLASMLQEAQIEVEQGAELPWFLVSRDYSATTTVGEARLALPTDFIREYEESALWVLDDDSAEILLGKDSIDDLRVYYTNTEGRPERYALSGEYFYLFPTPEQEYTIRMQCYTKEPTLSDGSSENNWSTEFPDILMGNAGQKFLMVRKSSPEIEDRINRLFGRGMARMAVHNVSRGSTQGEALYGGG